MTDVSKETELRVFLLTDPTEMGNLIATIGAARIETLASCWYHERETAVMLLVTKDPLRLNRVLLSTQQPEPEAVRGLNLDREDTDGLTDQSGAVPANEKLRHNASHS